MKVVSLFSGVGGLDYGYHQVGGFDVVFANDLNSTACETCELNFKSTIHRGDLRKHIERIPKKTDLLILGAPCQSFSLAGSRKGMGDQNGQCIRLFFDVVTRAMPSAIVFENVVGLTSVDNGKVFKRG